MHYTSLYPPLPDIPPQNVHNIILGRPDQENWPDFMLHVDVLTGKTRSFKQFRERVRDGATAIASDITPGGLGIRPGNDEPVGVLSENSMDYIALLHSLLVMTIPFALFSAYATPFEFQHALKLAAPTRLFVSPALLPMVLSSGFPDDRIYILEGEIEGRTSYADLVERVRENRLPRLPVQRADTDTLAYLVFSSGTSGLPKAVMISHGNLINIILQGSTASAEVLKVLPPPKWNGPGGLNVIFNILPIYHSYGLYIAAFKSFAAPTTLAILSKWNPDAYFDSIPKYRVTSVYLVPTLVHQIVHHPRFTTTDFSTVQILHSGAAHLPTSLAKRLHSRFSGVQQVSEGYGLSECTVSASLKPYPGILEGRAKNVPGSVGILLPGVEARIVREDGQLVALNEPGELHLRSGCVALGYWKNPKATRETFRDGWLRTGDRMRIDADGVLYFEDRAKDTLKVSGMQVSPTEIEGTLLDHPEKLIVDVTVAGVRGRRTSDERVPRAWVVLSPHGKALGATEVIERLDARVCAMHSRYKWLRGGIAVVDEIPKSPTGKVLRRVLVDAYEAESQTGQTAKL